jgi:hypothetical protein
MLVWLRLYRDIHNVVPRLFLYFKSGTDCLPPPLIAGEIYGVAALYARNEFIYELNDADLLGLIVEETGQAHDSAPARLTFNCIKHLKTFANFNAKSLQESNSLPEKSEREPSPDHPPNPSPLQSHR